MRNTPTIVLGGALMAALPLMGQLGGGQIGAGEPLFKGPSILSRGTRPLGKSGGRPITLRGFVSVGAGYFGGITESSTDEFGRFGDDTGYGGFLGFGGYGSRTGPRSSTSVDYTSGFQLFSSGGGERTFMNHAAGVQHSRQLSRRWNMFSRLGTSWFGTVLSPLSPQPFDQPFFDPGQVQANEVFDSRSLGLQGGAGLSYQKSARLSFSMSGGAFTVRRTSAALVSNDSAFASGEMSYRVSRRTSVGAVYSFGTSFYRRGYGEAFFHTYAGTFSRVISPRWQFSVSAGLFKLEMDQLVNVRVDPLVTLLTGQTDALVAANSRRYGLSTSAALNGQFQRSNFSLTYSRGANAGNGFVLGSEGEAANAFYSNTGLSRFGSGVWASWSRFTPVLRNANTRKFQTYGVGTGAGFRITEYLHFGVSGGLFRSDLAFDGFRDLGRTRYMIQAGLTFSPGEVPVILW